MSTIEKLAAIGSGLVILAAMLMAFLAIKSDHLDARLAFGAVVGFLVALCVLNLGKYVP